MIYTLLLLYFIMFTGCEPINHSMGIPNDNPIEEALEEEIRERYHMNIDLTPSNGDPNSWAYLALNKNLSINTFV